MKKQEIKNKVKKIIEKSHFKEDIKRASLFGSYASGKAKKTSEWGALHFNFESGDSQIIELDAKSVGKTNFFFLKKTLALILCHQSHS